MYFQRSKKPSQRNEETGTDLAKSRNQVQSRKEPEQNLTARGGAEAILGTQRSPLPPGAVPDPSGNETLSPRQSCPAPSATGLGHGSKIHQLQESAMILDTQRSHSIHGSVTLAQNRARIQGTIKHPENAHKGEQE